MDGDTSEERGDTAVYLFSVLVPERQKEITFIIVKKILIIFSFCFSLCNNSFAQKEFLVNINSALGTHNQIDSLPGVNWIQVIPKGKTFDKTNHRFIFVGIDNLNQNRLYSVDAPTATILSSPVFPILQNQGDNISELYYDNVSDTLYALHWDSNEGKEYLVWIDIASGLFTKINSIPGVQYIAIGGDAFDEINHRFILTGMGSSGTNLISIDATSGAVIYNPVFPPSGTSGNFGNFQMDNSTGILYALHWDAMNSIEYLSKINPVDGSFQNVNSLPQINLIVTAEGAFNELSKEYLFETPGAAGLELVTVDAISGNIIYSPSFPNLNSPENIIQFQFDNSDGTLYGLNWDTTTLHIEDTLTSNQNENLKTKSIVSIYPNPATNQLTVESVGSKQFAEGRIEITNSLGVTVYAESVNLKSKIINLKSFPSGIYFIKLYFGDGTMEVRKFVKE